MLEKRLANAHELEHSDSPQEKWLLSPADSQFWGSVCWRFERYIRSPCYSLAPLILSPSILSYVAAPVLEEFVSISPGTDLAWTPLPYLFKLTVLTKTFCPPWAGEFSLFRCIWRWLNVAWSRQITEPVTPHTACPALFNLPLNGNWVSSLSRSYDTLYRGCVCDLLAALGGRRTK